MAHLESLVVFDPHSRTREALVYGFVREGYKVYSTGDGQDALQMAQTRVPQLAVVSIPSDQSGGGNGHSPSHDALSMIGRLREEPATRELPIVAMGDRGSREEALRTGADEFVARPAFIRDVLTLAKLVVAVRQDGDDQGVAGMLEDYELYFLVRALSVANRSCAIELERGGRTGEVQFVKGEVVQARCGRMSGVVAFNHLLLWGEASMQIRMASPAGERKIATSTDELLAGGARFAREFESIATRVGGAQAVFRLEPRRAAEQRGQVPPEVSPLFKFFDGKRPFIDVVEDSPFKALDTIKITFRLIEMGVVERVAEGSNASPLTAQLAVRDWLLGAAAGEDTRTTVTEAGRRAAEAYAEEEARRAAQVAPAADVLDDSAELRAHADAPRQPIEDKPTAPLERDKGPQARNKKKGGKKTKTRERTPAVQTPAAPPPPPAAAMIPTTPESPRPSPSPGGATYGDTDRVPRVELMPSQPDPPSPLLSNDSQATVPFSRESLAELARASVALEEPTVKVPPREQQPRAGEIATPPSPKAAAPAPAAAPPVAPAAKPQAPAPAPAQQSRKRRDPTPAPPAVKEIAFTDAEEEFFAQEQDFGKVLPAENFDDLEPTNKPAPKRRWFNFGGKKFDKPEPKGPKKR
jgi:CheY-like chemotaxis protein